MGSHPLNCTSRTIHSGEGACPPPRFLKERLLTMQVMQLLIVITDVQELHTREGTVRLVSFCGQATGDYFQGQILPGAVDTQEERDGRCTLSARYMLDGTDVKGHPARLFVENEAITGMRTHPRIRTDSPALQWLEQAHLSGEIADENGQLLIRICTDENR